METATNTDIIERAYAAFGRGDIPAVLDLIAPDCEWGVDASSDIAPYYGVRRGRDEIGAFFQDLGSTFEVERFEPTAVACDGDHVLAVVAYSIRARETGKAATMNIHHHFRVRDGQISYFRGSEDTELVKSLLAP